MATVTWKLSLASGAVKVVTFDDMKVIEVDGEDASYLFQRGGRDELQVSPEELSGVEFVPAPTAAQ